MHDLYQSAKYFIFLRAAKKFQGNCHTILIKPFKTTITGKMICTVHQITDSYVKGKTVFFSECSTTSGLS